MELLEATASVILAEVPLETKVSPNSETFVGAKGLEPLTPSV